MTGGAPPSPAKHLLREFDAVAREFYRRLSADGHPATTRCERCERTRFPPRVRCPECGAAQIWVELPERGRLHAFTTQETALRMRAPAVLALVELGEVVVPGIVRARYEELEIGQEVEVELQAEPATGLTLLEFKPRVGADRRE